jgi:hypothetical protein
MIAQRYKVEPLPQRMSKLILIVRDSTLKPMASIGVPPTAGHLSEHYPDIFIHLSQLNKYRQAQTSEDVDNTFAPKCTISYGNPSFPPILSIGAPPCGGAERSYDGLFYLPLNHIDVLTGANWLDHLKAKKRVVGG